MEQLAQASPETLNSRVYNVTSFSLTAAEVREFVTGAFSEVDIGYAPDLKRQKIVDSWPADLNDRAARKEWGWQPAYDGKRAFEEYLIPNITQRYMND
jgi:nucleoside-diphosphate-sugar epimerase